MIKNDKDMKPVLLSLKVPVGASESINQQSVQRVDSTIAKTKEVKKRKALLRKQTKFLLKKKVAEKSVHSFKK